MEVLINPIMGVNIGIEYFEDEDMGRGIIVDFFVFRILLFFNN